VHDRTAITGVSYGGYLSMWAVTRSARFCAAISENGISNLLAEWGAEDDDGAWLDAELGGPPWERPEFYVASSPITAADRIRTPLLLVHADLDRNCPIGQSEQMLAALRSLGRDVQLVVIRGEGHLMNLTGRPSRRPAGCRPRPWPPACCRGMTGCASTRPPSASTCAWSPRT
jgi:dipeptidyl aminopeptidase/acylaminoacyl peptidase